MLIADGADASAEAVLGLAAYAHAGGAPAPRRTMARLSEGIAELADGDARHWPFGAVLPTPVVAVNPETVVRRCLTVSGVHNYAPWHLQYAIDFLADNHARFPFAGLVGRAFDLDDVAAAFRFAESERPVRVAVRG